MLDALKELKFVDLEGFFRALFNVIKYIFDKETGLLDAAAEDVE